MQETDLVLKAKKGWGHSSELDLARFPAYLPSTDHSPHTTQRGKQHVGIDYVYNAHTRRNNIKKLIFHFKDRMDMNMEVSQSKCGLRV